MMGRPGDRRQRWNESCGASAFICFAIAGFFICAAITSKGTTGIAIVGGMGLVMILLGMMDLLDLKNGWKMSDKRPPWADRHDAIDFKWKKDYEYRMRKINNRQATNKSGDA